MVGGGGAESPSGSAGSSHDAARLMVESWVVVCTVVSVVVGVCGGVVIFVFVGVTVVVLFVILVSRLSMLLSLS